LARQIGEVSVFFSSYKHTINQTDNQTILFVSCTDHIQICWTFGVQNTWSHAHMCLLGLQHL